MTPPPAQPLHLSLNKLTVPKEETYFVLVLLVSIAVRAALAISIIGVFYALFFGFFLWLGNGLLCAYSRSEAVRVNEQLLPQLYASYLDVCAKLGIAKPPALYVV